MKKIIFAGAFMVAGFTAAFAGSPKTETNSDASNTVTSTTAKSEAKHGAGTTYWVTGVTTINGQPAYTFNQEETFCDGGGSACQFTTDSGTLPSPQLQSKIEGEQGLTVDTRKD